MIINLRIEYWPNDGKFYFNSDGTNKIDIKVELPSFYITYPFLNQPNLPSVTRGKGEKMLSTIKRGVLDSYNLPQDDYWSVYHIMEDDV